jgi:hypothetical protein
MEDEALMAEAEMEDEFKAMLLLVLEPPAMRFVPVLAGMRLRPPL